MLSSSQSLQGTSGATSVSSVTSISTAVLSNQCSTSSSNSTPISVSHQGDNIIVGDIASNSQENPAQPVNVTFPTTSIGNRGRSFNPRWYEKYQWLEYSVSKDAIFCYPCRFFALGSGRAEDTFTTIGYKDWKHATGKNGALIKHDSSITHQAAMSSWCAYKANVQSGTSVVTMLDDVRREQIDKNRYYLKAVIDVLLYCAKQEIALRGHRESLSAQSSNRGKFLELMELLAKYDSVIHDRLNNGPKNAQYMSHGIQNELLGIIWETS